MPSTILRNSQRAPHSFWQFQHFTSSACTLHFFTAISTTQNQFSGDFNRRIDVVTICVFNSPLIAALEAKGKSVVWHDRRSGVASIGLDDTKDTLMGTVLNVPVRRYAGLWKGRHWIAMRKVDGAWYNLYSDLSAPQAFENSAEVLQLLDYVITHGGEVLRVMNNQL